MRVWKSSILLFVGFAILVMSAVTVSAVTVTDDIDDVWYYRYDPITGTGEVSMVGDKPNIDITSVSYTITGSELTLTMTVDGTIEDTMFYGIYFGNWKGDLISSNYYMAVYTNGSGIYGTVDIEPFVYSRLVDPVSGNTFTVTFEVADPDPTFEVWGIASESEGATGGEEDSAGWMWMDSAPNSYSPYYSGDDDDDDDTGDDDDDDVIISPNGDDTGGDGNGGNGGGIPGFEAIAVIAAIAVALIILRRKK